MFYCFIQLIGWIKKTIKSQFQNEGEKNMEQNETQEIIKCIGLLGQDGKNTKKQVREILVDLLPEYEEK
jgi:hypothetical protein